MAKKIVAKFNETFSEIEFYEIMDNFKQYTILREQGTDNYYLYDNDNALVSERIENINNFKNDIKYIEWYYGTVFFWADSKFVTEYGLPGYDKLIYLYRELVALRTSEVDIKISLDKIREAGGTIIDYLKCRLVAYRFFKYQKNTIKKLVKEFKLIW